MAKHVAVEIPTPMTPFRRRMHVKGGDPNYHYHWISKNDERPEFAEDMLGYEPVRRSKEGTIFATGGRAAPGDVIEINGMVLMRCPMDVWEARVAARSKKSIERMDAPKEAFMSKAESLGFEAVNVSKRSHGPLSAAMAADQKMSNSPLKDMKEG